MGSISSVYVDTDCRETNESDEEKRICVVGNPRHQERIVKVELNHSLTPNENNSRGLGITVKYLTEENVRLVMNNKKLERELQRLKHNVENPMDTEDRDAIYGESLEGRLNRLEKHLASERREKWSAIENSERCRVELLNREKELKDAKETVEQLSRELLAKQTQIEQLQSSIEELKSKKGESPERRNSMSEFRSDLKSKREARQKALAAISQELNALREELKTEKTKRRQLERELEFRKEDPTKEDILSDNASLKNEITILTENIEKLKDFSAENIRLKCEAERRKEEMDALNLSLGELKFEYYEEKRKHERTMREMIELEERRRYTMEDWEKEKEELLDRYEKEKKEINKRTSALKEVVAITKEMLAIREGEVVELKKKLTDIEESVKNSRWMREDGLKAEYEKQLENIKNLRDLYEERCRLMETERDKLRDSIKEKSAEIEKQKEEIETLAKEVETWREETKTERHEKENMERELRLTVAKTKDLENEITITNNLFTQMLLGPYNTGNETDLDKLTELLQENHDLIAEMTTREESSEIASVLPKLLLDLITQVDGVNMDRKEEDLPETSDTISEQSESLLEENQGAVLPILSYKNATLFKPSSEVVKTEETKIGDQISPAVQEIASNLPKVWRVLTELLSHHSAPEEPTPGDEKQCYKNVETPNGPRTVISVSKTFIRLKDLILEKKALQKELGRLKQLNTHLETRLDDQEKRLSQVQCELHKTWGIVGRMRAQHQQLHNNEKILRFELQEKRVMLSELKQELEYCRDKWERARQKNDESETEWKKLRREFAARKSKNHILSNLNDSGESGFSDEQNESGEDCENFDADRSSTQSPVDEKLLQTNAPQEVDLAQEIIKQSETNLKQTSQNVEQTRLEECTEVQASTSKTARVENERERAREARDLRLKRLEEQCKLLVRQVDITTHKSNYLNNRLEELHEQYGSAERQQNAEKQEENTQSLQKCTESLKKSTEKQQENRQSLQNTTEMQQNTERQQGSIDSLQKSTERQENTESLKKNAERQQNTEKPQDNTQSPPKNTESLQKSTETQQNTQSHQESVDSLQKSTERQQESTERQEGSTQSLQGSSGVEDEKRDCDNKKTPEDKNDN